MKTLYLDCGMGAAGDMLTAALLELLPDQAEFVRRLNALGIPGVEFAAERAVKCGVTGTHMSVLVNGREEGELHETGHAHTHDHEHGHDHEHEHDHDHEHEHGHDYGHAYDHEHAHTHDHPHGHSHHHSGMGEIEKIVEKLAVPEKVRQDVLEVYRLIARAESQVHGAPVDQIHFHEVGTLDAIADVTAVCLLMDTLAPEQVIASPVHVGSGEVCCAHGILPVPAPATALILRGIPIYGGRVRGELCTPTGAALLRHFVTRFGDMPVMRVDAVGYGMGKKDFPQANCVRAMLGTAEGGRDTVRALSCNVDDMTAEEIGFAVERLFAAGAREVYTVPIGMKKSRPGTLIRVLCDEKDREAFVTLLFRYTTTLGIREMAMERCVLKREVETVETAWGPVRRKRAEGYGVRREKWEYEDLGRIAREHQLSLREVRERLENREGEK